MRKGISTHVSAGGQPTESDLEKLKSKGVNTVVNLRLEGEEGSLTPAEERSLAQKLGFEYHHLPISLDQLDANQVKELRDVLNNSPGPVFVHCGMGQHASSLSLAASAVDAESIFEQSAKLGFPVQDERLKTFLRSLKDSQERVEQGRD
jgi:uncharacterized protein (TIGR01244 family)